MDYVGSHSVKTSRPLDTTVALERPRLRQRIIEPLLLVIYPSQASAFDTTRLWKRSSFSATC
jgi:hypothetical protein